MMSFCKRSVHSFLGFTTHPKDNITLDIPHSEGHHHLHRDAAASAGGLSLFTASTTAFQKPANVVESAAVKSPSTVNYFPANNCNTTAMTVPTSSLADKKTGGNVVAMSSMKRDPGGVGFLDEVGGSVDGLMSCTESLGFESSDERRVDDKIENLDGTDEFLSRKESRFSSRSWKKTAEEREPKKFPPPLTSLNQDGKPTFFLRPVRKEGRLELMEVKIDRPEILRASRQGGRLRLQLIHDNLPEDEGEEEDGEEEEERNEEKHEGEGENGSGEDEEEEEEKEEGEKVSCSIGEEKVEVALNKDANEERNIPGRDSGGRGGDEFRRYYNKAMNCHHHDHSHGHGHNHHHEMHVWRRHCVTTG